MATVTIQNREDAGSQFKVRAAVTLGTYATGGVSVSASDFGLAYFEGVDIEDSEGYTYDADIATGGATALIKAYRTGATSLANESSHTHAVALDSGASAAGSAHLHAFGTLANAASAVSGALSVVTPTQSGTGYATAAQVVTTTENFTAAENAYAGMWFMSDVLASSPAVLILSHPAAAGAPLVLTCNGVPPVTDAGAWRIAGVAGTAAAQVISGSVANESSHTHGPGTLADAASGAGSAHTHVATAAAMAEVTNGVNLSAITVNVEAVGK